MLHHCVNVCTKVIRRIEKLESPSMREKGRGSSFSYCDVHVSINAIKSMQLEKFNNMPIMLT